MTTDTPARHIAISGTTNFRDLGGYQGRDGRHLRWRQVFRSDHLADLTPQGQAQLQTLGVVHAVDFRGQQERAAHSYAWPFLERHVLDIEPALVQQALEMIQHGNELSAERAVTLMQDTYCSFVFDHADRFSAFFHLLLNNPQPLVFHCTAGKDRTGWAAALLLHALGVSRSDIEADYLLTNHYYRRPAELAAKAAQSIPHDVLEVLWRVQMPFINSAFNLAQARCGSMDNYLEDVLGINSEMRLALADYYLAP